MEKRLFQIAKFKNKDKNARKGRNPQIREFIVLELKRVTNFRLSGNLRAKQNGK